MRLPKKVFYRTCGPRFVHIREAHLQNMFNQNNVYERLNGEFEDRLKCVRGLKSEDPGLICLIITHRNFFRKHEGLEDNMTHAEAIRVDITPDKDSGLPPECAKWSVFIQNAAIYADSIR